MALKHKITINVTDAKGRHMTVLRGEIGRAHV